MRRKTIWICSLPVVLVAIVALVGSQFDLIGQSQSIFVRSAAGTYEVVATEKNAPLPNASCGPGLPCGSRQFTMNATFMDGGQVMADATDFNGELVCNDQDFGTASSTSHGVWRYNVKKGAVEFVMIRRLSIQGGKLKVTGSGSLDPPEPRGTAEAVWRVP